MRRGPKGNSPDMQKAKGETRPSRKIEFIYPDHQSRPDPEDIAPPEWMNAEAQQIWRNKIERYRQRGQKISGFEDALAQYVVLEERLIWHHSRGVPVPMAMVSAHRVWAAEFYDTPSSMKVSPSGGGSAKNRFGGNGHRPQS